MASGSKTCPEGIFFAAMPMPQKLQLNKKKLFLFFSLQRVPSNFRQIFAANFFCNFFAKQAKHGCHFFLFFLPECSRRWSTAALWIGSRNGQVLSRLYKKGGLLLTQWPWIRIPAMPGFFSAV